MESPAKPVTILCSATGLGVYIPGLLIQRQLSKRGYDADTEVIEEYYTPAKLASLTAYRDACRQNFALARFAHRSANDGSKPIDERRVAALLQRWNKEGRSHFILWSGFWIPVIEQYRAMFNERRLFVDHCRIDARISASFAVHQDKSGDANEVWLWNWQQRMIANEIRVGDEAALLFDQRDHRLVVHGGGWGLGSYRNKIAELGATPFALDIVLRSPEDTIDKRAEDRLYCVNPDWQPWMRHDGDAHGFPPVGMVDGSDAIEYRTNTEFHEFYKVIARSKAIVSKPGGCTLIDSLNSATPVVLLEPYGEAERSNGLLWQFLGFGITYADWQASGFDERILEHLHRNILETRRKAPDYVESYAHKLWKGGDP